MVIKGAVVIEIKELHRIWRTCKQCKLTFDFGYALTSSIELWYLAYALYICLYY